MNHGREGRNQHEATHGNTDWCIYMYFIYIRKCYTLVYVVLLTGHLLITNLGQLTSNLTKCDQSPLLMVTRFL